MLKGRHKWLYLVPSFAEILSLVVGQVTDHDKAAAAISAAHPRKFPYVAAANGATGGQQDESEPAG